MDHTFSVITCPSLQLIPTIYILLNGQDQKLHMDVLESQLANAKAQQTATLYTSPDLSENDGSPSVQKLLPDQQISMPIRFKSAINC